MTASAYVPFILCILNISTLDNFRQNYQTLKFGNVFSIKSSVDEQVGPTDPFFCRSH